MATKEKGSLLLRRFDAATNAKTEAVFARGGVLWELRYTKIGKRLAYEAHGYQTWKDCLLALAQRGGCAWKVLEVELKVYHTFCKVFPHLRALAAEVGSSKIREIAGRWSSHLTYIGEQGFCENPKVIQNVRLWLDFCKKHSWARVREVTKTIPRETLQDPSGSSTHTPVRIKSVSTLFAKSPTLNAMQGASMRLAIQAVRSDLDDPDMSDAGALALFTAGALTLVANNKKLRLQLTEAIRASQNKLKAA